MNIRHIIEILIYCTINYIMKDYYKLITLYFHCSKIPSLRNEIHKKLNSIIDKGKNGVFLFDIKVLSGKKKTSISNIPFTYRKTAAYVAT